MRSSILTEVIIDFRIMFWNTFLSLVFEAFRYQSPLHYCSDFPGPGIAMFDFGFGG
eukprot:UN23251